MKSLLGSRLRILLMVMPAFSLFTVFLVIPLVANLGLSFFNMDYLTKIEFIGFKNYATIFKDGNFWASTWRSFFFAIQCILFLAGICLVIAIVLSLMGERIQKLVRSAVLMPLVLSIVVIAQLWLRIYDYDAGILNKFLDLVRLSSLKTIWLQDHKTSLFCVGFVGIWQWTGLYLLLYISGIKSIPIQYYEAAKIDGATSMQSLIKVQIPLLIETIKSCIILATVGGFFTFTTIFVMTGGGPGTQTQSMIYYIYDRVFELQQFGTGTSAAAVAIFEMIVFILIIQKSIARERVEL